MRTYSRRKLFVLGVGLATIVALPAGVLAQSADFDADVGLDPGHSRVDVGAAGAGVGEYLHTLDVAFRVKPLLEAVGLSVNLSRTTSAPVSSMSNPDIIERTRVEEMARIQAVGRVRIFVSIHFNASANADPRMSGTETYYNADNAGNESFRLATLLQQNVLAALLDYGYESVDRGVKDDLVDAKPYGHFFSLRGGMPSALCEGLFLRGGMPSALCEGLFLSNPYEARLLLQLMRGRRSRKAMPMRSRQISVDQAVFAPSGLHVGVRGWT